MDFQGHEVGLGVRDTGWDRVRDGVRYPKSCSP